MVKRTHTHVGTEGAVDFVRRFALRRRPGTKLFLVAGIHAYQESGAAGLIGTALEGCEVARFSAFGANPKLEDLHRAIEAFACSGADRLLAVGGGSAIDMAKLVNYFASTGITPEDFCLRGKRSPSGAFFEMLAIPTTAGSGSEATRFAVLYLNQAKHSIEDAGLRPSHILLVSEFTASLMAYQVACCGFDALSHAIESYWALGATVRSRADSLRAMRLALDWLEPNVHRPTAASREAMMQAAHLAGRAINVAKTTVAHALSYSLTAHDQVPHGHAVSMFLPACMRWNVTHLMQHGSEGQRRTMKRLMATLGVTSAEAAAHALRQLAVRVGLHKSTRLFTQADRESVVSRLLADVNAPRLGNNPVRLASRDLRALVEGVIGGQEAWS